MAKANNAINGIGYQLYSQYFKEQLTTEGSKVWHDTTADSMMQKKHAKQYRDIINKSAGVAKNAANKVTRGIKALPINVNHNLTYERIAGATPGNFADAFGFDKAAADA